MICLHTDAVVNFKLGKKEGKVNEKIDHKAADLSALRSAVKAVKKGRGGLEEILYLRRMVFNVSRYAFEATILFGAKPRVSGGADNSHCILSNLASEKLKRLIWDYAGVQQGPAWNRIDRAYTVLKDAVDGANSLLSTIASEKLQEVMNDFERRGKKDVLTLHEAIDKIEQEHINDTSTVNKAKALLTGMVMKEM